MLLTVYYWTREKAFLNFFSRDTDTVYYSDVNGLMNELKPNIYKYDVLKESYMNIGKVSSVIKYSAYN